MKLKTLVTAVLTGAAASFAHGAVTVTSPADYATVSTYSSEMKAFIAKSLSEQQTAVKTSGGDTRTAYQADYRANSLPVTLKWSGSSGSCTVTVKRSSDGKQVMSKTLTGASVDFTDYEVGRNYTWTVKNGTTTVTGHFYVDRNAPYCIPIETSKISDARCVGGWKTSSGKVVKQGMIYRSAQFDWYYNDSAMYAYWKDKVGVKTEIELRDTDQVVEVREAQGQGIPLTGSTFGSDVT